MDLEAAPILPCLATPCPLIDLSPMPGDPTRSTAFSADPTLVAARDRAVVCDLAALHLLAISGADAATFLQGQLSADVEGLPAGACRYASFNSPKGRMLANFLLWRDAAAPDRYLALLPGDIAAPVAKRLAMYVLRSKVALADVSDQSTRFGIGGPSGPAALRSALEVVPAPFEAETAGSATVLGVPGPRFIIVVPHASSQGVRTALLRHATAAPFDAWRWLTIRAGVPVITAATQDRFVAQMANLDLLGGVDFKKGCYTGQEIIARTRYLGRLKERLYAFSSATTTIAAGDRLYSPAFGEQPCGTVVNAAAAPRGGSELLAVVQIAAAATGEVHAGAPDGPILTPLPLPYDVPAPAAPRVRTA
jgi:tRNA-modifying protein YgfZ